MRMYTKPVKEEEKKQEKTQKTILTVEEDVKIPGTKIILEKGDKIEVVTSNIKEGYDDVEILISDRAGVYLPQEFAETYQSSIVNFREIDKGDWQTLLNGPDDEWYWDAWNNIESTAILKIYGKKYTLYQNGDLFAVPIDWNEEDWEEWTGMSF